MGAAGLKGAVQVAPARVFAIGRANERNTMRTMLGALAALALAPAAMAQTADARFATTTLDLAGHGEAHVPPDMATIDLGVTTDAPTAAQAMADNAAAMTKVVAALGARGIEAKDIATSNLGLSPRYAYDQGQPPRLNGYEATNRVTVRVLDLTRLGAVVDGVVGAGATNVGEIGFSLKNRVSAENFARFAAVKALNDKAALYADAAGYHIRRLVNLSEAASERLPPIRPMMAMAALKTPAPTPVETGEIVVSVDVSGEFELTH
jgi:hypothetical protein